MDRDPVKIILDAMGLQLSQWIGTSTHYMSIDDGVESCIVQVDEFLSKAESNDYGYRVTRYILHSVDDIYQFKMLDQKAFTSLELESGTLTYIDDENQEAGTVVLDNDMEVVSRTTDREWKDMTEEEKVKAAEYWKES